MDYHLKYIKYKLKYLQLKKKYNITGGTNQTSSLLRNMSYEECMNEMDNEENICRQNTTPYFELPNVQQLDTSLKSPQKESVLISKSPPKKSDTKDTKQSEEETKLITKDIKQSEENMNELSNAIYDYLLRKGFIDDQEKTLLNVGSVKTFYSFEKYPKLEELIKTKLGADLNILNIKNKNLAIGLANYEKEINTTNYSKLKYDIGIQVPYLYNKKFLIEEQMCCDLLTFIMNNYHKEDKEDNGKFLPIEKKIIADIIIGLKNLYKQDFIHFDLKLENILINHKDVQTIDLDKISVNITDLDGIINISQNTKHLSYTPSILDPLCIIEENKSPIVVTYLNMFYTSQEDENYKKKLYMANDLYSLGIIIYMIYINQFPLLSTFTTRMISMYNNPALANNDEWRKQQIDIGLDIEDLEIRTWIEKKEERKEERTIIYNKYLTKTVNTFRETLKEQLSNGERTFPENKDKDKDVIDNLTEVLKILLNSEPAIRSTIIYPDIKMKIDVELSNFLLSNTYSMNLNRPESFELLGQKEELFNEEKDKLVFRSLESSNPEDKQEEELSNPEDKQEEELSNPEDKLVLRSLESSNPEEEEDNLKPLEKRQKTE